MKFDPLGWIDDELRQLESAHLLRYGVKRCGSQTAHVVIDGRPYINFSSNDYLGLAADPRLAATVVQTVETEGWGSGASPLVTGRGELHVQLEKALAEFEQTEAALLFPTGFSANSSSIPALVGREDYVFSDSKNHASIIDGCRLSGAQVVVYQHNDVDHLRSKLESAPAQGRRLIVTDGLFSMDGDFAPLDRLAALASDYEAMLMVDEAHATGVIGEHGRGASEIFGVEEEVSLRVGTLSKSLGSCGGFVVGQRRLIELLRNRARAYVFSTATPAAAARAGLTALEIVRSEPQRRTRLLQHAQQLRELLQRTGLNIGATCSQIIPVILGDPRQAMSVAQQLREKGLLVPAIRPPSVPEGESLLRISLSFSHSGEMIEELANSVCELTSGGSRPERLSQTGA
jgi:8-amino-7-oxononanoate synthase